MPHSLEEIGWREKEQAEARAVIAALSRSPLMARLFSYVCDKYFDGEAEQLNEVKIAMDVFGRTEAFDRSQDSIARVEAHRLRKKLRQYYESDGKDHPIQIELLPGSYIPSFRRKEASGVPHPVVTENGSTGAAETFYAPLASQARAAQERPHSGVTRPRWYWAVGLILAIAVGVMLWRGANPAHRQTAAPVASNDRSQAVSQGTPAAAESGAIRFVCGYSGPPHIGRLGEVWGADKYYSGGRPWPARAGFARRANDPFLFQNYRTGEFSYDIPARPGVYELHLYFIETEYGEELGGGENSRTFLVRLNGSTLFQTFDPLSDAGGPRIADERVFKDVRPARDGIVHISFESQRGQPVLNAIELIPGTPRKQLPLRLAAQVNSYTDHSGQIWAPDNYYLGGQFFGGKPPVVNTPDPFLFTSERAGNFTYAIPVSIEGTYTVNLYFAETYFGPEASGIGGVGSRVFNVTCNGVMLLDHFDIFKEAGSLRAVVKSFHGLKPNARGKLLLGFDPVANYASIFAIEVLDESK